MAHSLPPRWLLAVIAVAIVIGALYAVASIGLLPDPAGQRSSTTSSVPRKPANRPPKKQQQQLPPERSAVEMEGWCCVRGTYTCKSGLNPRSCKEADGLLFSPLESQCKRLCKPS